MIPVVSREKRLRSLLGQSVHVRVDRPMGYVHKGMTYPVNYGYVPGMPGGDGEDQDAYILGVDESLQEFDGVVIGAVCRKNDCEDKLVVAPVGHRYHQGQIAQAVAFQEQYFDTYILSTFRKSCGVIPWRIQQGEKEYLVLLQHNGSWSFPKGHMEASETEKTTALRELLEETGLKASLFGPPIVMEYDIQGGMHKQVVLFPGQVRGAVVLQKSEITGARWVRGEELEKYLHPDTCAACREYLKKGAKSNG